MTSSGRRRAALSLALVAVVMTTSACSPDWTGALGLTRDETGQILLIAVTCGAELDQVQMFRQRASQDGRRPTVGGWAHDDGLGGTVVLSLTQPDGSEGWTATDPWDGDVEPDAIYELSGDGGSVLSHNYVGPLGFYGSQLDGVKPGVILRQVRADRAPELVHETVEEFSADACEV
jgi:hypothetical protein